MFKEKKLNLFPRFSSANFVRSKLTIFTWRILCLQRENCHGVTVNSVIKTKVIQIMTLDSRPDNLQIYTSVSTVQGKHLNKLCETTHYFELNTLIQIFP